MINDLKLHLCLYYLLIRFGLSIYILKKYLIQVNLDILMRNQFL